MNLVKSIGNALRRSFVTNWKSTKTEEDQGPMQRISVKGYTVLLRTEPMPVVETVIDLTPKISDSHRFSSHWLWDNDQHKYDTPTAQSNITPFDFDDDTIDPENVVDVVPTSDEGKCFKVFCTIASQCRVCGGYTTTIHLVEQDNGKVLSKCSRCCEVCGG